MCDCRLKTRSESFRSSQITGGAGNLIYDIVA